jgi:uncharacterized protein (TIGR03435 family)
MRTLLPLLLAAPLLAQQSGLQFEVASIHPMAFPSSEYAAGYSTAVSSNPCTRGKLEVSGTRVSLTAASICDIIRIAYDLKSYQIVGIPRSLGGSGQDKLENTTIAASIAEADKHPPAFFDIDARSAGSTPPTPDQVREMLRGLLADRFHLKEHRDRQELSYYALVPAKNGPKLTPAVEGCKAPKIGQRGQKSSLEFLRGCGQTMEQIAKSLNASADKMVLDKTGITEKFDYQIAIDRSQGNDFHTVAAAFEDGLKLKLETRKEPLEVLLVDHVERPTEN